MCSGFCLRNGHTQVGEGCTWPQVSSGQDRRQGSEMRGKSRERRTEYRRELGVQFQARPRGSRVGQQAGLRALKGIVCLGQ